MNTTQHLLKAEIHVHLEATITPTLCRKFAARNNVSLSDDIFGWISGITFGRSVIGQVNEILSDGMVKILLYDNQSVNRNVTLAHRVDYKWLIDGYDKRIEDIELGLEYYQNNPEKYDSTKYQKLSLELKGLEDGTDRNRGERSVGKVVYALNIIEVIDKTVIAKIISKDPPYRKVRVGDEIRIKHD